MPQALIADARSSQLMLVDVGVTEPGGQWVGDPGDFTEPWGLAGPPGGPWAVADTGGHRVVFFSDPGQPLASGTPLGSQGSGEGEFKRPAGVTIAPDGTVYVADTGNARIVRTQPDGTGWLAYGSSGGDPADPGYFRDPYAVAVDADGRLWVADRLLDRVVRMDAMDGSGWTVLPGGVPVGVTTVGDLMVISNLGSREVVARDATGTSIVARVTLPGPAAVTFDGESVFALDAVSGRVLAFDAALAPNADTVHLKDLGAAAPRGICLT